MRSPDLSRMHLIVRLGMLLLPRDWPHYCVVLPVADAPGELRTCCHNEARIDLPNVKVTSLVSVGNIPTPRCELVVPGWSDGRQVVQWRWRCVGPPFLRSTG
jgi:hypothetical protein